jgi:hypothetical protein
MAAGRRHLRLDAAVDLLVGTLEPAAAAVSQGDWFRDLREPEHAAIERAGDIFAAGRNRELDVGDAGDGHGIPPIERGG